MFLENGDVLSFKLKIFFKNVCYRGRVFFLDVDFMVSEEFSERDVGDKILGVVNDGRFYRVL